VVSAGVDLVYFLRVYLPLVVVVVDHYYWLIDQYFLVDHDYWLIGQYCLVDH
jgi:hypothetical protein